MEDKNKEEKAFHKTHEECGCKREDFIDSLNYLTREDLRRSYVLYINRYRCNIRGYGR